MKYRNDLKKRILAGLLAGAALCTASAAWAANVVPNTQLPGDILHQVGGVTTDRGDGVLNVHQENQNAVIKWDSFNIGANATVNFEKEGGGNFNTLNYVNSANGLSQIYGTINAAKGNIYIVNPAGVEIGNSAQINTGSLYVSNKYLNENELNKFNGNNLPELYDTTKTSDAALMSLGNINATNVTFDGGRIVIDTERIKDENGDKKLEAGNIIVHTNDASNVVIGYDAYDNRDTDNDGQIDGYKYANPNTGLASVYVGDADTTTDVAGYMWVEDVEQLQAIGASADTLKGNYALRNSIDATATQDWNKNDSGTALGFVSIGTTTNAFTGKFDGLDYNIFNLNINRADESNVGLFGVVGSGAVINNVTLVGGSITGKNYVGALAGYVQGNAVISNITNSAGVSGIKTGDEGGTSIGGIIGQSNGGEYTNLVNTGTVTGDKNNIGGLIGNMSGGSLGGASYNLGAVTAEGYNVGGLVGHAYNDATIGNQGEDAVTVYNRLNVTGAYNVGGIVGNMEGSQVYNAENSGNVLADQFMPTDSPLYKPYEYHTDHPTTDTSDGNEDGLAHANANIANVGGIAGSASGDSLISGALNLGDVSSSQNGDTYYTAGNVGGIVGSAVDTDIADATNRENEIRGAHNVGGVAGYFANSKTDGKTYTISGAINDGGDIMATGARYENSFVTETIRRNGGESFIVGNMGGIVGYMDGDNVFITGSANRGTVHTHEPEDSSDVQDYEKAANVGGIVGKIDRSSAADEQDKQAIRDNYSNAAVSNSYNTGDVMGYTGVGGIAGMMYNGEIAGSYNLGYLRTTRQSTVGGSIDALNMGGIVGDTTETSSARVFLYDVYNKGQIGDSQFDYFGRHVGGIVGRLSGDVEKAYNTGAIYNGYNVVGGIAGWMYVGNIIDAFNTGNITVVNRNNGTSQVGGIVGAASTSESDILLKNVYNLGTLRSFQGSTGINSVGGILGIINGYGTHSVSITNAYTTGNIWAGMSDGNGGYREDTSNAVRSIWGRYENSATEANISTENTYYIRPDETLKDTFTDLSTSTNNRDNSNKAIDFDKKDNIVNGQYENQYIYTDETGTHSLGFSTQNGGDVVIEDGEDWRIYQGSTPILNAFLPNAEKYFSDTVNNPQAMNGIGSIQYGTAYDPLLTIIKANGDKTDLEFNWQKLGINNDAGLAVYGAGLTLNDFMSTGGSGYFGGLIYSDGALNINAHTSGETHDTDNTNVTGDVALGSASQLYGSSVTIDADGQVTVYGSVTATGNTANGATEDETDSITVTDPGNISITGGSVDVYGQLTSAEAEEKVFVPGINGMAAGWTPGNVNDPKEAMSDIGDRFGYTTGVSAVTGNISITANDAEDGHVNVYYGNKGEGIVTTGGNLTVNASGDIYMDSDLSIGGNLTLNAGQITNPDGTTSTAADSEAVLDISNIGKVQAANDTEPSHDNKYYLNEFLTHFADGTHSITLGGDETKIAVDMWGDGAFDLTKYDYNGNTLADRINALNLSVNGTEAKGQDCTYIWVADGDQLAGIQDYKDNHQDSNILSYNFALKNDIDASNVRDYKAIASGEGEAYTGTFDGRDNRIIGLDTTKKADGSSQTLTNAGIFDTVGAEGTVEDLRVYSGTFTGTTNAGAVAGVNKGTISNVTAFGNVVQSAGNAGGIAGTNSGTISNGEAIGTATAEGENAVAGGIAGTNSGKISDSSANSAVNASAGNATALGGVAGVNEGTLSNVDSLGVTTGVYKVEGQGTLYSDNVGGIAGTNSGTVTNVYNESIVSGRDNVGGILGKNSGADVSNVANASRVTGEADSSSDTNNASDYVGGLVGNNEGSITNGRNNGEITGNNFVGGLVGNNAKGSELKNLVNDSAAAITGDNYVGGIAGSNAGTISADEDNDNLINRGTITGQMYVGGVAGVNTGTIANTNNDVDLHVKNPDAKDEDAPQFFGGVAGWNAQATDEEGNPLKDDNGEFIYGTISHATNTADISANGAIYVGGVVGKNDGILQEMTGNSGNVFGASFVGGVIGQNNMELKDLKASNSGSVTATDGGAGGIVGENNENVTGAELSSIGTVSGTTGEGDTGTGGIFGVNSGNITDSILENLNGTVTGTSNTGGLIGINSGKVETSSLKNEADIEVKGDNVSNIGGLIGQNTGTITGGRTDAEGNDVGYYKYQIYNNGTITVEGNGSNIGGLIGKNAQENGKTGSLTAGYNTGAIIAEGSTNVGGIAGTNAGALDQVFNTVITADGQNQTITGSTNVGGIAGTNTGTISNAYNTTEVKGTVDSTGTIAGVNNNTADDSIRNVYSTIAGTLVGGTNTTITNGYNTTTAGTDWTKGDSYGGFDFDSTDDDGTESIWKIYEGSTNPLLKVFLTQLTVNETAEIDGQTVTLNDYLNLVYNGKEQDINIQDLIDKGFITGPDGMKDEDGNSFVFHAYENTLKGGENAFHDSDVLYNTTGQVHANENGEAYNWLASAQIAGGKNGNPNNHGYDIQMDSSPTLHKAQISITLDDVNRTYGDKAFTNGTNYGYDISIANGKNELTDVMEKELGDAITFTQKTDGAVDGFTGDKQTNNANKDNENYTWTADFGFVDNSTLTGDYTFVTGESQTGNTVTVSGNSHVDRAELTITAGSDTIYVGGTPQFSGTENQFVNGDSFQLGYGLNDNNLIQQVGTHTDVVGFWYNGTFYGAQDDVDKAAGLFGGNYNVKFTPGTLTVLALPEGMPDIPEIPGIENHWNGLLEDNPWDRNRDFRERKAEIHYIAGGMTL